MTDFLERKSAKRERPQRTRRSRRVRGWIAVAVVVLALVGAVFALDGVGRNAVADLISQNFRSALAVPESTPVTVNVGGDLLATQLLTSKLSQVAIDAKSVKFGEATGAARFVLVGLPLDQSKTVDAVKVTFFMKSDGLAPFFASMFSQESTPTVSTTPGLLIVSTSEKILGATIPLKVSYTLGVDAGKLTLTPTVIVLNNATFTVAEVQAKFGAIATPLVQPRTVCVANLLPAAFPLYEVAPNEGNLAFVLVGQHVSLSKTALSVKGTC